MPVHLVYRIVFRHLQPASAVMLTLVVIPLLLSIRAIPLAAAPARQPHLGLVAAYAFDEGAGATTADASGQGHIGALLGATWTPNGHAGAALSFDGNNDWVTVADSPLLDLTTALTLEAWTFPTQIDNSAWRTVIFKAQPGDLVYALYAHSEQYGTVAEGPRGYIYTTGERSTPPTASLTPNVWAFLAMTYDGATLRLFVNGVETSSAPVTGNLVTSDGQLTIGGNAIWSEWFAGRLDDVRIYNRALSAAEIAADMQSPVAPAATPTPTPTLAPACRADVSHDGIVNVLDIQLVAAWWLRSGFPATVDINGDGVVDLMDVSLAADFWRQLCNAPWPTPTPTATVTPTQTPTPTVTPTRTPTPPPATFAAPLRVSNPSTVALQAAPVTSGVPLPVALWITDAASLRVLAPSGQPIPAQFTVLARWGGAPEDSGQGIRWVLVDFQADMAPQSTMTYTLTTGGGGLIGALSPAPLVPPGIVLPGQAAPARRAPVSAPARARHPDPTAPLSAPAIIITQTTSAILVDTQVARFQLNTQAFNLFDQVWVDRDGDGAVDDALLSSSEGPVITQGSETFRAALGPVDEAVVELAGPLHSVVRIRGRHANLSGELLLAYTARLHFYAGAGAVRVFYGVWNDRPLANSGLGQPDIIAFGSPNSIVFDDLALELTLAASAPLTYTLDQWQGALTTTATLYQDSSGGPQWRHPTLAGETTFRGYSATANGSSLHGPCSEGAASADCRSQGWAGLAAADGGLAVGVHQFWQNYPKALQVAQDGQVQVALFPSQAAMPFELRVGERKTHEMLFQFWGDAPAAHPPFAVGDTSALLAWAPARWYADSGALLHLEPFDPARFGAYEGYNDAAILYPAANFDVLHEGVSPTGWTYLPRAEQWGWRNVGDTVAEDETSSDWPPIFHNQQYDHPYFFLAQALRTLDAPDAGLRWQHWWALATAGARHQADIDMVHGYCTGLDAVWMSHPLCLDSTGPPYGVGWAWGARFTNQWHADPSPYLHRYALLDYWSGGVRGVLWYYYLTGEGEARDAWLELAENARWRLQNSPCNPDCGPGYANNDVLENVRGPAYALEIMSDAYAATANPAYLDMARKVISDTTPARYFFGQPGFTINFGQAPSGDTFNLAFGTMLVKSGGHYLAVLEDFGLQDAAAEAWLRDYADLFASAWNLGAAAPFCARLGANGGCDMDAAELAALPVADALAGALWQTNPTPAERARWQAVALAAWQGGASSPWGGYAAATFMTSKSQALYGIQGHEFMRYAITHGLLP